MKLECMNEKPSGKATNFVSPLSLAVMGEAVFTLGL